ncbi:MAG: hypothetical protein IKE94_15900 [Aeriscardovia sp.]|nr:hypothetical protein [Aeriscardovia sp.]
MNDFEKWYRFCMICPHSYKRKDDADTVYCEANENHCPYRDEIEMDERNDGQANVRKW